MAAAMNSATRCVTTSGRRRQQKRIRETTTDDHHHHVPTTTTAPTQKRTVDMKASILFPHHFPTPTINQLIMTPSRVDRLANNIRLCSVWFSVFIIYFHNNKCNQSSMRSHHLFYHGFYRTGTIHTRPGSKKIDSTL